VEGSFSRSAVAEKARVVIARDRRSSGHPVDQLGLDVGVEPQQVLEVIPWSREWDQTRALVRSVKADLDAGMRPEDILVVPVNLGRTMTSACFELKGALTDARIPSIIVGEGDARPDEFKRSGHVTIAQMFRAKGNEAWKVYACNLHLAGSDHTGSPDEELRLRNAALVALTRSRLYTAALGKNGAFMRELAAAAQTAPRLEFTAFNAESLRRSQDVGASDD
jgi:superfamily I DNA and RNA helicase